MANILYVDDEPSVGLILEDTLSRAGHRPLGARNVVEALQVLARESIDLIISDYRMPGLTGLEFLSLLQREGYDIPLIMLTGYASIEHAVAAIKAGAIDYITKPVRTQQLELAVEQALEFVRLRRENESLRREVMEFRNERQIIGESSHIRRILQTVAMVAPTRATVLLQGESGTGKELFARALHAWSPRAHGPFIAINCAALPETLLESELFGYEKGAFTGAGQRKLGRFELAHRGTLFLDEVGELAPSIQAKILRVLETHEFERVGGTVTLHADVRLVAATNRRLRVEVAERRFREDLYFRLSVVPVTVPPLRERGSDVALLARHFLERDALDRGRRVPALDDSAVAALTAYTWPGNVRELQNCLERAALLLDGEVISARHLHLHALILPGPAPVAAPAPLDLTGTLADVLDRVRIDAERRAIAAALAAHANDPRRTADALGLGFRDLVTRMRQHGLGTE
jgi:DNA-binding NtrC family response regulator